MLKMATLRDIWNSHKQIMIVIAPFYLTSGTKTAMPAIYKLISFDVGFINILTADFFFLFDVHLLTKCLVQWHISIVPWFVIDTI